MSMDTLLEALAPILPELAAIELSGDVADTEAKLNAQHPIDGPTLSAVVDLVRCGVEAGWLCPRGEPSLRYGRAAKASPDTLGLGIETVDMCGAGPGHTHPEGEIDLCIALEGSPLFDGNPPGWTVYSSGSWHVPTVSGGRMGILYFLPGGAIRFEANPNA